MNPNIEQVQEIHSKRIGGWLLLYLIMIMVSTAFYLWGLLYEITGVKDLSNGYQEENAFVIIN
ncbi:hypothetical protein [Paenibacillus silviterrae]|uniref:hypothetical protein n=1 Tax=Paenibacillus silviterrae TaxID=3242194 RepID=UPI002543878E|nr:hypothetical protein [Paenibacillus chinjuensis]